MTRTKSIELRGAELAHEEAVKELRNSLHNRARDEARAGDDADGNALAGRCRDQVNQIQAAIARWQVALAHLTKEREKAKANP